DFHLHVTRTFQHATIVPLPDAAGAADRIDGTPERSEGSVAPPTMRGGGTRVDSGKLLEICQLPGPKLGDAGSKDASPSPPPPPTPTSAPTCGLVCEPGAWEEIDFYFDPVSRLRTLRIVEWGISDAAGAHTRKLLLTFDKQNAVLTGD